MINVPQDWSLAAGSIDAKRQREYAKRLMDFQMRQGGVTNPGGFYAGGATALDAIAKALTAYMGSKETDRADELARAGSR